MGILTGGGDVPGLNAAIKASYAFCGVEYATSVRLLEEPDPDEPHAARPRPVAHTISTAASERLFMSPIPIDGTSSTFIINKINSIDNYLFCAEVFRARAAGARASRARMQVCTLDVTARSPSPRRQP